MMYSKKKYYPHHVRSKSEQKPVILWAPFRFSASMQAIIANYYSFIFYTFVVYCNMFLLIFGNHFMYFAQCY